MNLLETKRKELEVIKVKAARHELEFRILEKESEIERLRENIKLQDEFIIKLELELEAQTSK